MPQEKEGEAGGGGGSEVGQVNCGAIYFLSVRPLKGDSCSSLFMRSTQEWRLCSVDGGGG